MMNEPTAQADEPSHEITDAGPMEPATGEAIFAPDAVLPATIAVRRRPRLAWGAFLILLAFVVASRLVDLGVKPYHHDESLFAYYGWQQARNGVYHAGGYDRHADATLAPSAPAHTHHPLLHGPLQIQLIAFVLRAAEKLKLLGDGNAAARLLAALCGIGLFGLVWAMRRDIGHEGRLPALAGIAVSPGIWYYSRFCRNEALFLFVTLAWVLALARAWRSIRPVDDPSDPGRPTLAFRSRSGRWGVWVVLLCVLSALLVALKENSLFLLFDAATFAVLLLCFDLFRGNRTRKGNHARHLRALASRLAYAWAGGLALAWLLLDAVYTNGFQWDTSFLSMYADVLHYWTGQHVEHRLYGEFHYHLPTLLLYEFPTMLVLAGALVAVLTRLRHAIAGALMVLAISLGLWSGGMLGPDVLKAAFHMTKPWHPALASAVGWATLSMAWFCLREGRRFRAWLVWWCGLSFLQYSYAGEKVPWVSLHIALPAILLAADLVGHVWRTRRKAAAVLVVFWVVGCLANFAQGYRLCLVDPTNPGERLVYNHTQPEMGDLAREMVRRSKESEGETRYLIQGGPCWPLFWHLRETPYTIAQAEIPDDLEAFDMLVCDTDFVTSHTILAEHFDLEPRMFRRAWRPQSLHLFRPVANALEEVYGEDIPAREDWTETDMDFIEDRSYAYGRGAWKSLLRLIVRRQPWGDPNYECLPLEIQVGTRRIPSGHSPEKDE